MVTDKSSAAGDLGTEGWPCPPPSCWTQTPSELGQEDVASRKPARTATHLPGRRATCPVPYHPVLLCLRPPWAHLVPGVTLVGAHRACCGRYHLHEGHIFP